MATRAATGGGRGQSRRPAAAAATEDPAAKKPAKLTRIGDWAADLPGQKFGQFKVGPLFAKGKTGFVFHARHIRKNLDVALKVLDPKYGTSESLIQRFNQAMKAVLPLPIPTW